MKSLTVESIANLDSLQLRAKTLVQSVLTGTHRGRQKGFSIDFSEHRDYSPGDDVRFIDWKLLAKRDRFYIRQFEAEHQLQAWMLLDVSGSMLYRSQDSSLSKLEYAATLAAAMTWITCYQRDHAGVHAVDGSTFQQCGPVYGNLGAKRLITTLEEVVQGVSRQSGNDSEQEDLLLGLSDSVEHVPRKSVVFVLSDGFSDLDELKKLLLRLRNKNCDVRFLHVLDEAEFSFPFAGNVLFKGLEGGEYQTQSQTIRNAYRQEFQQFLEKIQKICKQVQCEYWGANTQDSPGMLLKKILQPKKG